jgi:N-acetylmuramoyl-L-alanine amidase
MRTPAVIVLLLLLAVCSSEARTRHSRARHKPRKVVHVVTKAECASMFSTVVIDAGHGGQDAGGIPQNIIPEKGVALDVALRLDKALRKAGFRTILTRRDDTFIPLDTRVEIANAHPEAVFVSIHFDASPRREARGSDTHYAARAEAPLAATIQRHMMTTTDGPNRGIKTAGFRVLRKTKYRAVLVECGFLTNPDDVKLARSRSYRKNVAKQICGALVEYRGGLVKPCP